MARRKPPLPRKSVPQRAAPSLVTKDEHHKSTLHFPAITLASPFDTASSSTVPCMIRRLQCPDRPHGVLAHPLKGGISPYTATPSCSAVLRCQRISFAASRSEHRCPTALCLGTAGRCSLVFIYSRRASSASRHAAASSPITSSCRVRT